MKSNTYLYFKGDLNIVKPKKVDDKTFKRSMSKTISTAAKSVNRPKTAPSTRSSAKAPFMSYGCGARKLEIGGNKTYNVRAGAEVSLSHHSLIHAKLYLRK